MTAWPPGNAPLQSREGLLPMKMIIDELISHVPFAAGALAWISPATPKRVQPID